MSSLTRRKINLSDSSSSSTESYTTSNLSPISADSGFAPEIFTHTIGKQHPIVSVWEPSLKAKVMALLMPRKGDWQALEVFRRGYSQRPDDCEPTVFITVRKETVVTEWEETIKDIKRICFEECGQPMQVEVMIGSIRRFALEELEWNDQPPMGSGISVASCQSYGTLGGFLILEKDGQPINVGLTCHHVLSQSKEPIICKDWKPSPISVHQPCDRDHDVWNSRLEREIEQTKEEIQRNDQISGGFGREGWKKTQNAIIDSKQSLLDRARGFDREIGKVFATSGLKVSQSRNCSIDWGLVTIKPNRLGINELSMDFPHRNIVSHISGTTIMQLGWTALKRGRPTGWTAGQFNEIRSHCMLEGGPAEGTTEWAFVGYLSEFSQAGDSGAWVVTEGGDLGGLLFAGHCSGSWTYVTPIMEVFEDIKKTLGCTCTIA